MTNSANTLFHRAHHRFAVFMAICTFVLILAGATVTSNDAGLSVPDWPTSFGSLYRIPPMVNGVQFEHGHRMIAQFIGFLTIILAVWTQRVESRPWVRALAWGALATVVAQGILGGITVLFKLPPAISTAHATLGQTFFCLVITIALFTSREWAEEPPALLADSKRPRLATLSLLTVVAIYVQLILGAGFRHSGMKLLPHLVSAVVVTCLVLWTARRAISQYKEVPQLQRPAASLFALLLLQVSLGASAYATRVVWDIHPADAGSLSMVVTTVAHVAVGALLLATAVVLAIQARRRLAAAERPVRNRDGVFAA